MRNAVRHAALAAALVVGLGTAAQANMITNGSFESGSPQPGVGSFATIGTGGTALSGWSVAAGNIDWINAFWQASDGTHSVDLNGNAPGTISQSFATAVGSLYRLTFDLSGNPDGFDGIKQVLVSAGDTSSTFDFDTTATSRSAMGWVGEQLIFMATSALTTLTFESLSGGPNCCYGPAIDNVVVELAGPGGAVDPVPAPATLPLIAGAIAGLGWLRRRSA
ncbi:MAG: choice-of-anchor C family protein [Alphaproteobacteria bacterium]|nr:choice-of-anchor C family protein [Alphaproteobacteria bacterium]